MATDITAITDSVNSAGTKGGRSFQGLFSVIPFQATLIDASLAANLAGQCDIAVPGAEVGDFVLIAIAKDTTGLTYHATVSAADVVTITTWNVEGTDANTTLATAGAQVKGVVLKPSENVFAQL